MRNGFSLLGLFSVCLVFGQQADPLPPGITTDEQPEWQIVAEKGGGPSFEEQVIELVNQERLNNGGLAPLKAVSELMNSSETHSQNMALRDFFAHCDLDTGLSPFQRMTNAGYNWNSAGENIAAGQASPASVMTSWMNSSGHRANILSTSYRELGVGYYNQSGDLGNIRQDQNGDCTADLFNTGPYTRYWTQNFGRRSNVYPIIINREAYETDALMVDLYIYGSGFATEMRLRNDGESFGAWEPYNTQRTWNLRPQDGIRQVFVEIRNASNTVIANSDTILLSGFFSCLIPDTLPQWPVLPITTYVSCVGP
ncbi:MAG: hypothetical protein KDC71_11350 [Acidobacteria bacterium]|nr:hypothetical protein [Acidobacteriota bacterium]